MKENKHEYDSLRNEIISFQELQRSVWIYMYVVFCSLFVLGLEWSHYLFLITYIILIPFQCAINDYKWYILKMSTYIKVFFEDERAGISWESLQMYDQYKKYYGSKKKSIRDIIKNSGAMHLGFLATGFYCGYTLRYSFIDNRFVLELRNIIMIALSIVLFIFLVMINREYYTMDNTELESIMMAYKEERAGEN